MGMCLDLKNCGLENREKARFCAQCGIPLRGTSLQGRYEIQNLISKDRGTVTLEAIDRHSDQIVMVRALIPRESSTEERENFLQDAELALSFSARISDTGSIRVTDYGQDGPIAFLVKSELQTSTRGQHSPGSHIVTRVGSDVFQRPQLSPQGVDEDMATQLRIVVPNISRNKQAQSQAQPLGPSTPILPLYHDWLAEGNVAYEQGHYEKALEAYEAASTQDIVSVDAWSGKGATLLHLGHAGIVTTRLWPSTLAMSLPGADAVWRWQNRIRRRRRCWHLTAHCSLIPGRALYGRQ